MNCALPYWIQLSQALLTPAIAVLAGVIAFFQWRTAHKRVAIDLFDRRMRIYTDCRRVLQPIIASPDTTTFPVSGDFLIASNDAEFLFGDDVITHIKKVGDAISDLALCNTKLTNPEPGGEPRTEILAKHRISIRTISGFYGDEFRSLLRPYMRLKQTLWW